MQAGIDHYSAGTPELIFQLKQSGLWFGVEALLIHQLLAIERPAFGKEGGGEFPPDLRFYPIAVNQLKVMTDRLRAEQ